MRIAFLGLGIMGSRMAANLALAGLAPTVWNRTRATAEAFCRHHPAATLAESPAAAAAQADVVFTMVVDGSQVHEVLLGPDGAADGAAPATVFVDCSTIGPAEARRIAADLAARNLTHFLDAPVTGSSPKAEDGTLTFMVGGDTADFDRVRPALDPIGELIVHAGPLGHGQMIKVINNAVAAINTAVVGQALLVGARTGVDLDALQQVMGAGSGASAMLALKAGPMRAHDYSTLFRLDHMLKDVRLCLVEARAAGVPFDFAQGTETILSAAATLGHGDDDFAALIEALEGSAGTRL